MRPSTAGSGWLWAALLAGGVVGGGCARPSAPTGGPRDFIPPMVVSTWPDTFETIEPTRDPVEITFSERISERTATNQDLEGAVIVSPVTGEYQVKHTRAGLEIELLGGFKPDLVYRVRVLPIVRDLFQNALQGPFELVFSTGAPFETNVVAGIVRDRITGEVVDGARVEARDTALTEPPVYVAATDSAGVFALRYLPAGAYRVTVFQDLNRNGEANYSELQAEIQADPVGTRPEAADTAIIRELMVLRPDTIPARVISVEALDPVLVRVGFDDYLNTEGSLDGVDIQIGPEEGAPLVIERLMWPRQRDSLQAAGDSAEAEAGRLALLDSLQAVATSLEETLTSMEAAGDTLGVDTVGAQLDRVTARLEPPEEPEEPEEAQEPALPPPILPRQEFFALMADSLPPDLPLQVTISGVTNLNGVGGGGGETSFTWEPPEEEPDTASAAPDTALVPPDTSSVPPDTGSVLPDTSSVPPDTSSVPPDTSSVPPDTSSVPPDTNSVPPDTSSVPPDTGSGPRGAVPDWGRRSLQPQASRPEPLWWLRRRSP